MVKNFVEERMVVSRVLGGCAFECKQCKRKLSTPNRKYSSSNENPGTKSNPIAQSSDLASRDIGSITLLPPILDKQQHPDSGMTVATSHAPVETYFGNIEGGHNTGKNKHDF